MFAYRLVVDGVSYHDNDDDGEDGAGRKLAELLRNMMLSGAAEGGVLLIVSRWYGGVKVRGTMIEALKQAFSNEDPLQSADHPALVAAWAEAFRAHCQCGKGGDATIGLRKSKMSVAISSQCCKRECCVIDQYVMSVEIVVNLFLHRLRLPLFCSLPHSSLPQNISNGLAAPPSPLGTAALPLPLTLAGAALGGGWEAPTMPKDAPPRLPKASGAAAGGTCWGIAPDPGIWLNCICCCCC